MSGEDIFALRILSITRFLFGLPRECEFGFNPSANVAWVMFIDLVDYIMGNIMLKNHMLLLKHIIISLFVKATWFLS